MLVDFMYKRRVAEVLLDFCLICVAYYSAYRLRFEGADFVRAFPNFLRSLPVVIATQLAAFFVTGAYRSTWRYFGLMDAVILAKGVVAGAVAVVIGIAVLDALSGYAYATFIIYPTLLMLFVTGSRASFRLIGEFVARRANGPRVIVYSSGQGESRMARDMLATLALPCRILGFISSEPERARGYVQGYPVMTSSSPSSAPAWPTRWSCASRTPTRRASRSCVFTARPRMSACHSCDTTSSQSRALKERCPGSDDRPSVYWVSRCGR
jgi:FlaA1/EpsC-like NDP-sugar epimerase